jgi:diguanylate cyclase (GGDEF)-like protein/PAS domain S-box-containing protein
VKEPQVKVELDRAEFERLVLAESADLVLLVTADEQAVVLHALGAGRSLSGRRTEAFVGTSLIDRVLLEDAPSVQRALARARRGEEALTTFRLERSDGTLRWCEITASRPRDRSVQAVLCVLRDVTVRRELEAALTRQAETDPLTGVANRTVFRDRLVHALSRLPRSDGHVAVLFLDLDHFKAINDSMGHGVGDRILIATAQRLLSFLRPSDTLARVGGDEFAILLEDLSSASTANALAERISEAGTFPFALGSEEVLCTISVGVAETDDASADADELLSRADLAMYHAKGRGRQGYEVFDERLRGLVMRRLDTQSVIRRAVSGQGLVLRYQPIVSVPDRVVVAAEALVRIRSGTSPLLMPADFLDVANETGLVRQIDSWVLRNAALQAHVWRQHSNGSVTARIAVHVNLTARHLTDPGFAGEVLQLLDEHDLVPGSLGIEVREDDLERLSEPAIESLFVLRERGVRIVLDEFGAGSCSLTTLRAMPLDLVKVHRAGVAALETSPRDRAVLGAVIGLCHDLDLPVLAVGVETAAQLQVLVDLGCDQVQGFLLAGDTDPAVLASVDAGRPWASAASAWRPHLDPAKS